MKNPFRMTSVQVNDLMDPPCPPNCLCPLCYSDKKAVREMVKEAKIQVCRKKSCRRYGCDCDPNN